VVHQSGPPTAANPTTNTRNFDCTAFTSQHGVISNKYSIFYNTSVRTSHLAMSQYLSSYTPNLPRRKTPNLV